MKYKYIILDFGKVIANPTTGKWSIPPLFRKMLDEHEIDMKRFKVIKKKYEDILNEKVSTLTEEYAMFTRYYSLIFEELNNPNYGEEEAKKVAYDRTYNNDKYTVYETVYEELSKLKEKYTIIMLSDNWPSVYSFLEEKGLMKYFDDIYISSVYGENKKDKKLFDYPIRDYNIKEAEALFIDDNEQNLDNAKEKGLDVLLMNRENATLESAYEIITDLSLDKVKSLG